MDKYNKDFKCKNCGAMNYLFIPVGQSVEFFLNEKAYNCQRCKVRLYVKGKEGNEEIEENEKSE